MNFNKALQFLIILAVCNSLTVKSASIVYNMRIAETTRHQSSAEQAEHEHPFIASLVSVNQFKRRYNGLHQTVIGAIASLNYSKKNYYLLGTMGFGNVKDARSSSTSSEEPGFTSNAREKADQKNENIIKLSKTQTDDLLFYGGVSKEFSEKTHLTFSAILGIPTHRDNILQDTQLGTGHFGIGCQADGSFIYTKDKSNILIGATRFIYFVPRIIDLKTPTQVLKFDFDLGNLVDIYISNQTIWGGKNRVEFGYNGTFGFSANILPSLNELVRATNFIRSNFFLTYARGFIIKKHIGGIVLGGSYGIDHTPKSIGFKSIWSFWIAAGINF